MNLFYQYTNSRSWAGRREYIHEIWKCKNHSFQKIRGGGIFGNLDRLKNMRSRNFGGEGGVRVIWRNPDLTGFSLMTASLIQ